MQRGSLRSRRGVLGRCGAAALQVLQEAGDVGGELALLCQHIVGAGGLLLTVDGHNLDPVDAIAARMALAMPLTHPTAPDMRNRVRCAR